MSLLLLSGCKYSSRAYAVGIVLPSPAKQVPGCFVVMTSDILFISYVLLMSFESGKLLVCFENCGWR